MQDEKSGTFCILFPSNMCQLADTTEELCARRFNPTVSPASAFGYFQIRSQRRLHVRLEPTVERVNWKIAGMVPAQKILPPFFIRFIVTLR